MSPNGWWPRRRTCQRCVEPFPQQQPAPLVTHPLSVWCAVPSLWCVVQALLEEVLKLKAESKAQLAVQSDEGQRIQLLFEEMRQLKDDMRVLLGRSGAANDVTRDAPSIETIYDAPS